MPFQKATKRKMKLRCALEGPPGSGKTYTALRVGRALVGPEGRIAVIDTERGSASKYSDEFDFDVVELDTYAPATFVEMIREAEAQGYDLLIIDSLSHAWMGAEGMLDQVDKIAKRRQYSSNFPAWKDANPQERELWDAMLGCGMHLVATLRTKTEYVIEDQTGRDGKKRSVPKKVGLAPIQREGMEYEFDLVAEINTDHDFIVTKTRCKALTDKCYSPAGEEVAEVLRDWLGHGGDAPASKPAPKAAAPAAAPHEPPTEREAFRATLVKAMKDNIGLLRIPAAIGTHVVNVRGYAKTTDMPDNELAKFVDQLGQLLHYRETGVLSKEHMLLRLQDLPDDGADPVENLLIECAQETTPPTEAKEEPASPPEATKEPAKATPPDPRKAPAKAPQKKGLAPNSADVKASEVKIERLLKAFGLERGDLWAKVVEHLKAVRSREGEPPIVALNGILADLTELQQLYKAGQIDEGGIRAWFDRAPFPGEDMLRGLIEDTRENSRKPDAETPSDEQDLLV
jgi:DNA polymerase III delta prime subunit